jgi:4-amino-4-deoxy-L-arabinose transferase-like glycosyltransferase
MGDRTLTSQPDQVKQRRNDIVSTALAVLLACIVLLPLLGHKLLTDWDEGIYAEIAREMLGQSWLVPHWNFQPWFEKPPLMMWVTATFFRLFGVSEFWARAGSALSGVALVGLLHAWLARRGDQMAAWLSTFILLTTLGFLHVARVGEMDVLLSLGCAVAVLGLAEVSERRLSGWYWFWAGFAVALMTKGAASVTVVLTAVIVAIAGRWGRAFFTREFWLGLAAFLVAVLPWHIAMWHRFGEAFFKEYLGFHTLARATEQIEGHTTHWWFYLWVLLVSAAPYVLLFPVAIARACKRAELRPWAVFALVEVAFFSVVQTRLPHYIAPAYPALALVTAIYIADWLRQLEGRRQWTRQGFLLRVTIAFLILWGLGALATATPRKGLHSEWVDGKITHEEKESIVMLSDAFHSPQPVGPVLVWREHEPRSIATAIFYTHRSVKQVQLETLPASIARDKYSFDPAPLDQMVIAEPRLILLDKSLVNRIPQGMAYAPLASGRVMEVGTIRRAK